MKKPFVSVIVPVYNDSKRIEICIKKLLNQTYPKNKYEIIVVDNISTDNTPRVIKKYPVKLFFEKNIQSSYAARNKGLEKAKGEIIAFTDSDCQPTETWLENGVNSMIKNKADLVAGKVSFIFKNENDPYEIYDSISNIQQKKKVSLRGEAATANLFTKKKVFEKVGLFPNNVKSGGDATWTGRASRAGHKIVYEKSAELFHPTRTKKELLEKQYRVGYGQIPIWRGKKNKFLYLKLFRGFLPPGRFNKELLKKKNTYFFLKVYFAVWNCQIHSQKGRLAYLKDSFFGYLNDSRFL